MDRTEFIGACAEGGRTLEGAVRRMVRDCTAPLMRDAVDALGPGETARDLVQDTLIRAWQRCRQFRGDAELMTWLRAILRHAVIDWLRARHDEVPLHDDDGEVVAPAEQALLDSAPLPLDPHAVASRRQLQQVYEAAFARFAAEQPLSAAVIRWVAEDGLRTEELAQLLGRSPGATREFVSQCRKKARHYLADWYALVSDAHREPCHDE